MKVKKRWRMGIHFFSWKRFIPLVRTTFDILPGRHFSSEIFGWFSKAKCLKCSLWSIFKQHTLYPWEKPSMFLVSPSFFSNETTLLILTVWNLSPQIPVYYSFKQERCSLWKTLYPSKEVLYKVCLWIWRQMFFFGFDPQSLHLQYLLWNHDKENPFILTELYLLATFLLWWCKQGALWNLC